MTTPRLLGALDNLHRMMADLVQGLPDADVRRQFDPALHPPGWYLGRAVYVETYWLRERLLGDADLSRRVRHIFAPGAAAPAQTGALLPPRDHLLNWALEIQDEHLTRLANPGLLPQHPLLADDWLPSHLWQVQSLLYEQLLLVLIARQIARSPDGDDRPAQPLSPRLPTADAVPVSQGHYRIGAREGVAFDNELPVQAVELHSFRIGRRPVSNAEYLAFMEDGGYARADLWSGAGRPWLAASGCTHPYGWRRGADGSWHGIGLNGAYPLVADEPVTGLCLHEAQAFAAWAASLGRDLAGAVLPHEYQWETAVRTQAITQHGRALEWCSNPFDPYDGYAAPADPELATAELDGRHQSVRGASVHTQPCLRRASLRRAALPEDRYQLAGGRLVLPPPAGGGRPVVRQGMPRATPHRCQAAGVVALLLALPLAGEATVSCPALPGYEIPRPGDVSEANRRRLAPDVERVAKQHRIEPALLHALIAAESGFNPVAVSPDGAIGLMQLMPVTAREYGEADLCDPVANIETGTAHFARLLRKYRNISHAIAAYNAGEGTMQSQRRRVTYLETRKFVVRAINLYWRYTGSAKP